MSFLGNLREAFYKVRIVPSRKPVDQTTFMDDKEGVPSKIQQAEMEGTTIDLTDFTKISAMKGTKSQKYETFEEMVRDGRIAAAIEIYSNDSVQFNQEGRVLWIESDNADVAAYCEKLISDLNIEQNLWSYAYNLWLYGDVYLETFENASVMDKKPGLLYEPVRKNMNILTQKNIEGAKLQRYIRKVPNPAEIYDLQYKGKTAGFIKSEIEVEHNLQNNTYVYGGTVNDMKVLSPTKYVHICLSPNINRFPEKFTLVKKQDKKINEDGYVEGDNDSENEFTFEVKSGQSVLENVYTAYQSLKLKEDSVLLERITKSSITRIIQVELGDMPESQKIEKLREIKNQIEQQLILNKQAGNIQSRPGAQPIENIIYTTTKDGKGTISSVNIGGDVDIGNLGDVEQAEDKLFGSLLIPKGLLGADMEGSGLSNGGSLTEMNTTYARRIKRGQMALISGITDLINIFALADGLGDRIIGKFQVRLTPIITIEDNRRDDLMRTKIQNVGDILNLIDKMDAIDQESKIKMLVNWLGSYLNQQEIVNIINERLDELEEKGIDVDKASEEEDKEDSGDIDMDINVGGPSSGPDFGPDISGPDLDMGEPTDIDTDIESEPEPESGTNEPELAPQENLADIEGEDLL